MVYLTTGHAVGHGSRVGAGAGVGGGGWGAPSLLWLKCGLTEGRKVCGVGVTGGAMGGGGCRGVWGASCCVSCSLSAVAQWNMKMIGR